MRTTTTILAALLMLALGVWLAWLAIAALRSGVAYAAGNREFRRKKSPAMYWLAVIAQSGFSAVCIYSVVLCAMRLAR